MFAQKSTRSHQILCYDKILTIVSASRAFGLRLMAQSQTESCSKHWTWHMLRLGGSLGKVNNKEYIYIYNRIDLDSIHSASPTLPASQKRRASHQPVQPSHPGHQPPKPSTCQPSQHIGRCSCCFIYVYPKVLFV